MTAAPTLPRWSLHDLLPDPPDQAIERYLSQLLDGVALLETARPTLSPDMATHDFLALFHQYEAMSEIAGRVRAYSFLWFAENTQNPAALNLRGRLEQVLTEAQNRTLFLGLWFKDLPDDAAARLIAGSGDLHYHLESLRRFKPFTLSEVEEKLINLKDVNGIDALVKIYEMITNRFTYHLEVDGERKSLTRDQLASYYRHQSPDLRAAAYRELFRVYGENSTILAQIYSHRVRDWHAEALDVRGYAQPISFRNLANDLPDAAVDALLSVCRRNTGLFQRYFKIKARRLGAEKLRRYDIYASFAKSTKQYDFGKAIEMVLGSFQAFSPQIEQQARNIVEARHLDVDPRPGKRSGAFCYAALPGLAPWVLTNFTGEARDVATLAHELGHAVHAQLAAGHSILTFSPSLPMAETASVFSEMLLSEQLLKQESDPAVRLDMLAHTIDDAYVTVMRQAFFTIFERDAHRMISAGGTFDELAAHYLENLHEQFGDAMDVSDEFRWEWIAIPHIYSTPFYTYAYSFGQLLVLALYEQYRAEGPAFIPRYIKILAAGGSQSPVTILREAGLDVTTEDFWQGGFHVIKGLIDELEALS
jgi:oligoendopeptidase F